MCRCFQKANFIFNRQSSAYMYHTDGILTKMGFSQIKYGNPQKGDIYIQDRHQTHEAGHIDIYNGTNW